MPKHHRSDVERDKILSEMGYRVLRFWNTEIDENIDGVIETILTAATAPTPASEARRPSPLGRDNQD